MALTYTLITGASGGIGEAIARVAAADRRNLILAARSADKLEALAAELRAAHTIEVAVIPTDLTEPGAARALWAEAQAEGREITMLVNNAGLGHHGIFADADPADIGRTIDLNLTAVTELMHAAIPDMRAARRGRILNVASLAAMIPGPWLAVYHASKSYVLSLSISVAEELRGTGVTITALCPGPTRSNFFSVAGMTKVPVTRSRLVADTETVARAGYRGALEGTAIVVPGTLMKLGALATRAAPRPLTAAIVKRFWTAR